MPIFSEVLPLVQALYKRNAVGCCLHIVLDDGNVEDSHVQFCQEQARKCQHSDCLQIAWRLLHMSKTQRRKLYNTAKYGDHTLNG